MSCCINIGEVIDWYEWDDAKPMEITDIVALAELQAGAGGGGYGSKVRATDFAVQTWVATAVSMIQAPTVRTNGTDKGELVADAEYWMFDHKTWNSALTLPIPLRKVIFLRAGTKWRNELRFLFPGPVATDVIYLALRDNAGTRGDAHGAYPVLKWTSTGSGITGSVQLYLDLKRPGRYHVVLWVKSKPTGTPTPAPQYSMYEMEWIVVD
ncbi:MAG TPA: hypothetical protein VFH43_06340 [Candidatus Kapabacteria bacterium]|jgi:hypothetical protein|nr:hypothetical protein [Candidatus Kapabacteria bacterium]